MKKRKHKSLSCEYQFPSGPLTAREAMAAWEEYLAMSPDPPALRRRRRKKSRGTDPEASEILLSVMNDPPNSKAQMGRIDAVIERCAIDAAKGNLSAAEILIDMHNHSKSKGDFDVEEKIRYINPPKEKA